MGLFKSALDDYGCSVKHFINLSEKVLPFDRSTLVQISKSPTRLAKISNLIIITLKLSNDLLMEINFKAKLSCRITLSKHASVCMTNIRLGFMICH